MRPTVAMALAILINSGCTIDDAHLETVASHITGVLEIDYVLQDGYTFSGRKLIIHGMFPPAEGACRYGAWKYKHSSCYGVHVYCNGALLVGEITSKSSTEIRARIPERPSGYWAGSGSLCSVAVKVWDSPTPEGDYQEVELDIGYITPPPIEIHGVQDYPRPSTSNQHFFALYGFFPTGANFSSVVTCDGEPKISGISTPNKPSTLLNQVNIWFTETDYSSRSCVFTIRRSNDGAVTPAWYQRINGARPLLPSYAGAYYWGGFQPDWLNRLNSPAVGVRRLRDAGLDGPVRFTLTPAQRQWPSSRWDWYDDIGEPGYTNDSRCSGLTLNKYLPMSVCTVRMQNAFAELPSSAMVVLTTMDETSAGLSGGAQNYVDEGWMTGPGTPNFAAVKSEYYHLARNIFVSQANTSRTFVISNWEADNLIFCGGPASFVADYLPGGLAEFCSSTVDPLQDHAKRLAALTNWFRARQEGIDQARAEAGPSSSVSVWDAIEFNVYRMVQGTPGLAGKDALHGIIPVVQPKYALYSAWETSNRGGIDQDFVEIAAYLYAIRPADPIRFGIGELGWPGQAREPAGLDAWILREDVRALQRSVFRTDPVNGGVNPLRFGVIWQAYPTIDEEQGLLTVEGAETNAMRAVRTGLQYQSTGSSVVIAGVREIPEYSHQLCPGDAPPRSGSLREFELYGTYPAGGYTAYAKCSSATGGVANAWSAATVVGVPNSTQINITVSDRPNADMWCVFRLYNYTTLSLSSDFGPIRSYKKGPCNAVVLP